MPCSVCAALAEAWHVMRADKAPSPDRSANFARVRDGEIVAMVKDHLSVNSTAVVTWEDNGKAVVKGSKTEGAGVLLVESLGYRHTLIRGSMLEAGIAVCCDAVCCELRLELL